MEQVQVKITGMAITQRYGTLSPGDTLRTDAVFAKHLVEECGAAEYTAAPTVAVDAEKATKSRAKKSAAPAIAVQPESSVIESAEESSGENIQPDSPQE